MTFKIDFFVGKGVIAVKDYSKGEFILEYDGELISKAEGERKLYASTVGS
jgi:SET domain-containing protein